MTPTAINEPKYLALAMFKLTDEKYLPPTGVDDAPVCRHPYPDLIEANILASRDS